MASKSERTLAILAVLILHVVGVAVLVGLSRNRFALPVSHPIELVLLPPNPRPVKPAAAAFYGRPRATLPASQPLSVITPTQSTEDGIGQGAVDWNAEAARQAASSAGAIASASKGNQRSNAPAKSDWFPVPRHFKGEEIPGFGGETMVFINDHCYQTTSVFRSAPTASNNGMGLQTYCLGDADEPRGDLFKDLEVYKKRHPER